MAELAERIKGLRSAHAIEPTPDRAGKRRVAAEEPFTARIRRQAEAGLAEGAAVAAQPEPPAGGNGAASPAVVDLKAAVRCLRYNDKAKPGNTENDYV